MLYLSETVAMFMFLLLPALVLAGLWLPQPKFNARKTFRHGIFRIETTRPAKVVAHDEVVLRLSAASAIEGIWERHKARCLVPMRMEVFA